MKINTKIRIKVARIIITRLEKYLYSLPPHGWTDPMITYDKIEYYEEVLDRLLKQ